jgi:maleate isomerase
MERRISMKDEDLLGWRARIGLLVPDSLIPTEPWFYRAKPKGVTFLTTRMLHGKKSNPEELRKMRDHVLRGVRELANAEVDVIGFCCTGASFIGGIGYDKKLIEEIENEVNIPATTTSTAVVEAIRVLDANPIVLVTPYVEETNRIEKQFLEDNKISVQGIGSLNKEDVIDYTNTTPGELYRLARNTFKHQPSAAGVFISCMSLQAMDVIEALETDLEVPVITSDQAILWKLLRLAGVKEKVQGFGRLLSE